MFSEYLFDWNQKASKWTNFTKLQWKGKYQRPHTHTHARTHTHIKYRKEEDGSFVSEKNVWSETMKPPDISIFKRSAANEVFNSFISFSTISILHFLFFKLKICQEKHKFNLQINKLTKKMLNFDNQTFYYLLFSYKIPKWFILKLKIYTLMCK